MNYKVLYRKYRPSNFDELVGQEHIKKILKNSIINDKIAHAYIFTGPRGTGKTSSAKIFARTLNCLDSHDGIPCGKCVNCLDFNTNPDIIELDAASNNSVDDIREIIDSVNIAPTMSKYKVYIIDEVHMLSSSAWNAFLKTLEEPPAHVIFILATTDIQKVPVTVLSRCQRFDFQRIERNLILMNLKNICEKEDIKYEEDALNEISYLSDGCMRDALSLLDQLSKVSDSITMDVIMNSYGTVSSAQIDEVYSNIIKNDIDSLVETIGKIKQSGIDVKILIDKILDNFIEKAVKMKKKNVSNNVFSQLKNIIERLNILLNNLNSNSNGFLLLELELISFINDDNNKLSSREIDQIISQEIINSDSLSINIDNIIKNDKKYYNVSDNFIDIRINNSFAGASKNLKAEFVEKWNLVIENITKNNKIEFINIVKNSSIAAVSKTNALFITNSKSSKIVNNSKLHELEILFSSVCSSTIKFAFITKSEWDKVVKNFDKNKAYEYIDDKEFINDNSNDIKLAENIFKNDKINFE